jgi:hypothetical protein
METILRPKGSAEEKGEAPKLKLRPPSTVHEKKAYWIFSNTRTSAFVVSSTVVTE